MIDDNKPYLEPEEPNFGKTNIGYNFINAHHEFISGMLFICMLVICCAGAIIFYPDPKQNDTEIFVTTSKYVSNPTDYYRPESYNKFKQKMADASIRGHYLMDSLRHYNDSIQHVQDSIAFVRDSIAEELRIQDSIAAIELAMRKKTKVTYMAVIDDGITKRTVDASMVVDSVIEHDMSNLEKAFTEVSVNTVRDRQVEIDSSDNYYNNIRKNEEQTIIIN